MSNSKSRLLTRATTTELSSLLTKASIEARLGVRSNGLILPVDGELAKLPAFSPAELLLRKGKLLARWADLYIQEIEKEIISLSQMRDRYNDLAFRATNQLVSQIEFDGNEAIHNDEVAAGWYTIQSEISQLEQASQTAWATSTKDAAAALEKAVNNGVIDWKTQDPAKFAAYKANVAVASMFSVYNSVHKQYAPAGKDSEYSWMTGNIVEGPFDRPPKIIPAPQSTVIGYQALPNAMWGLVRAASLPEVVYSFATVNSQTILSAGAAASARFLSEAKIKLATWNKADAGFRVARTKVGLDTNALRRLAQTTPRGPFNLSEQLSTIRSEFADRLSDVYAKCSVTDQGLRTIWQFTNLPSPPEPEKWDDSSASFFEDLLRWCRVAKRTLADLNSSEVNSVFSISLKHLISTATWERLLAEAKANNAASLAIRFILPQHSLRGLSFVRVRGLIAYSVGIDDEASGPWKSIVTPPMTGASRMGAEVLQDQPKIDLARIHTREWPKPPDVVGMVMLRNILPCAPSSETSGNSEWTIEIDRYSLRGSDATDLQDIELDLLIAGLNR